MDDIKAVIANVTDVIRLKHEVSSGDVHTLEGMYQTVINLLKESEIQFDSVELSESQAKISVYFVLQKFIQCIQILLLKLGKELENIGNLSEGPYLSVADVDHVSCLLQFVFKFGIVSHLEPSIQGIMISKISHFYTEFTPRQKYGMLLENSLFIHVICKAIEIRNIVTKNLLPEIIASYMQLCFSPNSARLIDMKDRKRCLQVLNEIIESWISKSRLIQEIFVLQGNPETRLSPKWLREKCGSILSRTLLEKEGMKAIISAVVENSRDSDFKTAGWEHIVALSSIISTLPSKGIPAKKYCISIGHQAIELISDSRKDNSEAMHVVRKVAVTTLHALYEKYHSESDILESIICKPLSECCFTIGKEKMFHENVSSEEINDCIENLHDICISIGIVPDVALSALIKPYLKIFFQLICDTNETSSHLNLLTKELLCKSLKCSDDLKAEEMFFSMYGQIKSTELGIKTPLINLKFEVDANGNVCPIANNKFFEPSEVLQHQDIKVNVLLDILSNMDNSGFIGVVFISLLKIICDPSKNFPNEINEDKIIMTPEDRAVQALKNNETRFITFGLLTTMCETYNPNTLLSDVSQIISFIKTMLQSLDNNSLEMLGTCASVLGICLMSDMTSEEKSELLSVVPLLQKICGNNNLDKHTRDLLSDLTIAISTYGAVNETSMDAFSVLMKEQMKKFENMDLSKETQPKCNEETTLPSQAAPLLVDTDRDTVLNSSGRDQSSSSEDTIKNSSKETHSTSVTDSIANEEDFNLSFSQSLDEVFDPSPAIKGGSIRYLTKCIERKLPIAFKKLDKLVEIFVECLDNQDSFVYLSAVQALAVIGSLSVSNIASESLLKKLINIFMRDSETKTQKNNSNNTIDAKMKVGEIIMRIIRHMGDMGPYHASILLPEFLKGSRHVNPDMRASCLSNFSELAPMAPYYLSQIQQEINECLSSTAKSDPDPMVRRAAVHAIRNLITKLGSNFIQIFSNVTKQMYRTLKFLYERDEDTAVQLHAQLALEELDNIMRETIFKKQTLSKKITVLPI
ncbi:transport and Golgi organization protein 6 homolog [Styela clava]